MIELRDCVRSLIALESEDGAEEELSRQQAELNRRYDSFQAQ